MEEQSASQALLETIEHQRVQAEQREEYIKLLERQLEGMGCDNGLGNASNSQQLLEVQHQNYRLQMEVKNRTALSTSLKY